MKGRATRIEEYGCCTVYKTSGRKWTISIDNLEEYKTPERYDLEYGQAHEVNLICKWASATDDASILDLACGSGRLTIPLAEAGFQTAGVDLHQGMLELASKKADRLDLSIPWYQQDCTQLKLPASYSFVTMVGNAFQHFLTNESQTALLQSVWKVLREDGIFIFDARFPSAYELRAGEEEYERTYHDYEGHSYDVYSKSTYDSITQVQHNTIKRKQQSGKEEITHIDLRYTYPQELRRLLQIQNFRLLHIYADWEETPLHPQCRSMVVICQKEKHI
ncbi:class I SAM-dependent methyltransferase [Hazenella sp. IB182357]|uniref:Class I SAM-dependent methyltransferase n=1 Tax=Polycladospora coralii TaxID=2771432 RepID=A0A926N5C8_9BACL|nr:class I SAM-dependent methyltransferase [Polycladospora coralii]MBD1370751.1 class I SAM-dependent methyltransferase [Polycladospora coralii]MBS7529689.1 class I SAM-dependent methyltransferase [Polycladospora coralii]